ncbi:collagen binding domain-containing protein [Paenibacillus soyae]|uniref:SpaA isopeptide-forming pilin-related protein n=1 Tax=Paenibacillus soyae TaxID=2969249 RepID=A0A9X2SB61_9BACL|nr:collagen binding domain-containing protein [Paenibacillus soyae]MCR2806690.1 SpaA isopeptide-forming pilin-related protein [Paenibacillus soyae]
MKKKARILALVLSLMLVFQYFNYAGVLKQAEAADDPPKVVNFTKVTLGTDTSNKDAIASVTETASTVTPGYEIDPKDAMVLEYHWNIADGHGFVGEDNKTFTFSLPDAFNLRESKTGSFIDPETSTNYGGFHADPASDVVTMTFNENVEETDYGVETKGSLFFWVLIDESKFPGGEGDIILIPGADPIKLKLKAEIIVPDPPSYVITKSGQADKSFNPTSINWTINANSDAEIITNAVVTDVIPNGLTFSAADISSISITKIEAGGNSAVDPVAIGVSYDAGSRTLSIPLGDISTAYRIEFATPINDNSLSQFDNTASLGGNETGLPKAATTTVPVNRGIFIDKWQDDYDAASETITWKVKINLGQKQMNGPVFIDWFDDIHELVTNSVKISKIGTITANDSYTGLTDDIANWTLDSTLTNPTEKKNGFSLTYNGGASTNSAYELEYQTKLKSNYYIYKNTPVNNVISSNVNVESSNETYTIAQRFFHKNGSTPNYKDRTISWTVQVNQAGYDISNTVYKDTLSAGQRLLLDTLMVNGVPVNPNNTTDLTKPIVEVDPAQAAAGIITGFTLKLPAGTTTYTVKYDTSFDYDVTSYGTLLPGYNNSGVLTWTGPDGNAESLTDNNNTQTLNARGAQSNGYKDGNYDASTKQITWSLLVNYNSKKMANAKIVDELQSVQKLDPTSVKVYETAIKSDGTREASVMNELDYGTDYTFSYDALTKTLTIDFIKEITKPHFIQFKTDVEDELLGEGQKQIPNTAIFSADGFGSKTLKAPVDVPIYNAGSYIDKTGTFDKDTFTTDWKVTINLSQSNIFDITILDTPSENQLLLKDSFKLYQAKVAANGSISYDDSDLVELNSASKEFELEFKENGTFELRMAEISRPYVLEYSTLLDVNDGTTNTTISNDIDFTGFGKDNKPLDGSTNDDYEEAVNLEGAGGFATRPKGKLTIIKSDAEHADLFLKDAVFELRRPNSAVSLKGDLTTDENGTIVVENLAHGKYVLHEKTPPTGYKALTAPIAITIEKAETTISVPNERQTGDLDITKVDKGDNTKLLPGAKFVLYRADKTVVGEVTTGADETDAATFGKASFNDLPFGSYVLKETQTPSGYLLDGKGEYPIEIKPGEDTAITIQNIKFVYIPGVPTPTPTPTPEPTEEPEESATPSPTPTPTPKPTPTPGASEKPKPTPTPAGEKTTEDTPVVGEVDVPKGGVTEVGTPPSNGHITLTPDGKWEYTPKPGFTGKDRFSVIVVNEDGVEEEIWFEIDVEPIPEGTVVGGIPDVNELPKTGQTDYTMLYLLGAALVGGGLLLRWSGKRKSS